MAKKPRTKFPGKGTLRDPLQVPGNLEEIAKRKPKQFTAEEAAADNARIDAEEAELDLDVAALQKQLAKRNFLARSLTKVYGGHAVPVLLSMGVLTEASEKAGKQRMFKLSKELPSRQAFGKALKEKYSITVGDAVSSAFSDLENLASEVREIVDNASGTNFENTQRIQTLSETADTLEGLQAPDMPDLASKLRFLDLPSNNKKPSRADQRDNATSTLSGAVEAMRDFFEKWDACKNADVDLLLARYSIESHVSHEDVNKLEDACDEVEQAIEEAEGVEFPGMYG